MLVAFFAETEPASKREKPACIKNTSEPAYIIQCWFTSNIIPSIASGVVTRSGVVVVGSSVVLDIGEAVAPSFTVLLKKRCFVFRKPFDARAQLELSHNFSGESQPESQPGEYLEYLCPRHPLGAQKWTRQVRPRAS